LQPAYFEIGKILSPRGLAGELRVYPLTDEPSRFGLLDEVFLEFPPDSRAAAHKTPRAGRGAAAQPPDRGAAAQPPDRGVVVQPHVREASAQPPDRGASVQPPSRAYHVESARVRSGLVFLKLAGVDDVAAAEKLRGALVKIPPEKALPLEEGEYYIRDLIGLEVATAGGEALGVLTDVLRTGANDVYVVGGKLMIPAVRECVLNVDTEKRTMTVALTEGLREL